MRILLIVLLVVLWANTPADAGKNAGGSLIVNVCPANSCTFFADPCDDFYGIPPCEDMWTEAPFYTTGNAYMWLIAAFHETADPGVSSVSFGFDHNLPSEWLFYGHACGPEGTYEIQGDGWPIGPNADNQVVFGESIIGERMFKVYGFSIYPDVPMEGRYLRVGPHGDLGLAAFLSDDVPPAVDRVENFGEIRWDEPGSNQCPTPQGACCLAGGGCVISTHASCEAVGGLLWLYDMECDANPCGTAGIEEDDRSVEQTWGQVKARYR